MLVVFIAHLARPAEVEADALAPMLGVTAYEARLALVTPAPAIVQMTSSRDRANDVAAILRSRGHIAHVFDEESFVPSERMTKMDDFRLDADGVRREADGELLPFGDVFAILRAVHRTSSEIERPAAQVRATRASRMDGTATSRVVSKNEEREHVAYFFRRRSLSS